MNPSLYQASVPRFARMLDNLSAILDKAEAHVALKQLKPEALTTFRLFPDMLPFTSQIQIACDAAKGAVARLAGLEVPRHPDTEQTLAELKARIAMTRAFIGTAQPAQFAGAEDKEIVLKIGGQEMRFKGVDYLFDFAIPNFYFHVTTAYAILRHNGVELGKRDFLGGQ